MSTKDRGRSKIPPGQGDSKPTQMEIQRKIRVDGVNRPQSKAGHMRRGDRRDTQPQK